MSRFKNFAGGALVCVLKAPSAQRLASPERFMNLCRSRLIELSFVREISGQIEFTIGLNDYRKLRPVVRKCHMLPHIKRRYGLPFLLRKGRRHSAFFAGICAAVLLLFIFSGFIWNIEIKGNYTHTDESLIQFMETLDVYTGQRKVKIDPSALEEELRLAFEDISWVSARIEGTVLKIELKEGTVRTPDASGKIAGNVTAAQAGTVTSIVTRSGTARVSPGDVVEAGDVLIEGTVDIYNDDGTVQTTHPVHGDGDVYADMVYHCDDYYPAYRTVKNYIKKPKYALGLELFGRLFIAGDASFEAQNYETTTEVIKYRLTPNFYLPLRLYKITARAYEPVREDYTAQALEQIGEAAIRRRLTMLESDGAQILSHSLKTEIGDGYYHVSGDIIMNGSIGTFVPAEGSGNIQESDGAGRIEPEMDDGEAGLP